MKKEYSSEEEFLKEYDSSVFKKMSVATDLIIIGISSIDSEDCRKLSEKKYSILLSKRTEYPYKGKWCLPGGFVKIDETIDDAVVRILKDKTNLTNMYFEQLYTFSDVERDPRTRIISASYMSLVNKEDVSKDLNQNTAWFDLDVKLKGNKTHIYLQNQDGVELKFIIEQKVVDKTSSKIKYCIVENDGIGFDHPIIINYALDRIKNKAEYTDLVFNMMPKYFTLGELQQVYEVVLGKKLLAPAFRRIINGKVTKSNKIKTGGGYRPSVLYKYINNN